MRVYSAMGRRYFQRPFGGYGGIWDDTKALVLSTLPSEFTGVTWVDVSEGDAGVVELKEIIPTMEGKVALSARAQVAMWKILKGEADSIDRLMAKTADIGGPEGEAIRLELELAKEEVIGRAAILAGANEAAAAAGVPPATVDEWLSPAEASRTAGAAAAGAGAVLSSPAFWGIVIVGVLVVAIVIYSDYMKATKTAEFRMLEKEKEIDALKQAGASPDQLAAAIIARAKAAPEEKKFPWGWVLGIGAAGVGVMILVAWAEGSLQRWTKGLRAGPAGRGW